MAEDQSEISRNFTPALPKTLEGKGESPKLPPQEVQEQTQKLFDLLVHRVELRIDIARQSDNPTPPTTGGAELSIQQKVELVKNGGLRVAVAQVSGENVKARTLTTDLKELRETEERISDLTKNPAVIEQYGKFREERIDKLRKAKEVSDGQSAIKQLHLQQEKMARNAFLGNRQYSPGERRIIDEDRQLIQAIDTRIAELRKDPEVFDLARIRQLEEYQKGLKRDRFAETPSREKYIDSVRAYWAQGKKVLLTGPTGGGKTELLLHASRSLFGAEAERLTGHELMTNYEVYGKTKGGVQDGQVTLMFGAAPFIRAIDRNVPFVFDEINVVPNKILMRLKTDLNARVGQEVTIQEDSDKKVRVGDKFAVGATENVKSEKHVEREKLDPALVRMFEPLAIDYFPPEELYDIMLASMMDARGGIKISVKDANDTLKSLCDATDWIQKAFLGQAVQTGGGSILEARGQGSLGKAATLQEAVLDPGKSLDMLAGWEDAEKSGLTFREFLNKRIVAFVNNENYPEEDRYYLTEVFALQGFLKGVKVTDLRVAGLDQATLDAWSGYDGKRYVPKNSYTQPEVVAKLDPYGTQKRPVGVEAKDLLDDEETVEEVKEEEIDAAEAAKKAVQTRSAKQQPTPTGKPAVVGATFGGGPMSVEGKFKIDALDIQYDPKNISGLDDRVKFNEYPQILVNIAQSEPTTIPVVLDRFNAIVDQAGAYTGSSYYKNLTGSLLSVVDLVKGNKQILLDVAKLVAKIDAKDSWKTGSFSGEVSSNIKSIRGKVMGVST